MEIRPLYFADEIFYWARIGRQATVLELQCTLTQKIDPEALEAALLHALRVHTNFRIRPVIVNGRFQAMLDDLKKAPLYAKDGRMRQPGTDDTEGLMLYAEYEEKDITLHVFHGLSDLRGMFAFLNTMLKFYYHESVQTAAGLPEPDSTDTIPCYEKIMERAPGGPAGSFLPDEVSVFHLPEKTFGKRTTVQRVCEIDLPLEPLLAVSKRSGSSVVPTLQAFIGRAIRKTYDVGEKTIIGYTPVDLRPVFHFETSGNASSSFPLPYSASLDRQSIEERALFLRNYLNFQKQPENLYSGVKRIVDKAAPVIKSPLPPGLKAHLIVNVGRMMDRASYTYGLSYAGKVRFDEAVDPYVASVTACAGSYSYPLWIMACEFHGTLRMILTQSYESIRLAKNICKELSLEIPGMNFTDRGYHAFDEFHWTKLRRIDKNLQLRI